MRITAIAMLLVALPIISNAQGNRADSWEATASAIFQESNNLGGEGGSSLDIDSAIGFGINFAYNLSSKLALGMDFEFLRPDYSAILIDDTGARPDVEFNHELRQFNGRFKGAYNFTDGPFTPFVEAGFGWSYFDSNVADGPPATGCYWHPWWGYVCANYYDTFDDTVFTYGLGAGLRYEFVGGAFIKASYNYWEMDGLGNSEDADLSSGRLEFGWMFLFS